MEFLAEPKWRRPVEDLVAGVRVSSASVERDPPGVRAADHLDPARPERRHLRLIMPDLAEQYFDSESKSAKLARDFAVTTLASWGLSRMADDIRLCVSELAGNALAHGGAPGHGFSVRLTARDGWLGVEVHDGSPGNPLLRCPEFFDVSGRGLLIVEELSADWGVERREPFGKVVWARFAIEEVEGVNPAKPVGTVPSVQVGPRDNPARPIDVVPCAPVGPRLEGRRRVARRLPV